MISFAMETAKAERQAKARQAEIDLLDQSALLSVKEGEIPPDIYYIILDGYTRADALQELFDFDNSYFLDELEKMGFYVADCAMSNYAATKLCLATTLNLDYQDMDELDPQNSHPVLEQKIRNSLVWQELGKLGYTRVSFDTGYRFSNMNDADYFLTVPEDYKPVGSINNFETLFIRSTALTVLIDKQWLSLSPDEDTNQEPFDHAEHVIRERYKLETLHTIAELPSPKFVFAHIIIPHHPYIFRPNGDVETDPGFYGNEGRAINDEYRIKGYVQQIEFINSQMLEILDNILKQSVNPPIIIMQGDHGTEVNTNLILSTYYLPGGEEKLYPNITPINTFRIVLNEYFHTNYPLLPDISLYSDHERILDQVQVFEENPACILP
jgi:hypothetical protein